MSKVISREAAAAMIQNGDTVVITGSGGGVMDPYALYEAIEQRFLETGAPNNLTLVHCRNAGAFFPDRPAPAVRELQCPVPA